MISTIQVHIEAADHAVDHDPARAASLYREAIREAAEVTPILLRRGDTEGARQACKLREKAEGWLQHLREQADEREPTRNELFRPVMIDDEECDECCGTGLEYDGSACPYCSGGVRFVYAETRPAGPEHTERLSFGGLDEFDLELAAAE
jgi:hypothetical protein